MNLAGFCRNCLSKWYKEESNLKNLNLEYEDIRTHIYGMPYEKWKARFQKSLKK